MKLFDGALAPGVPDVEIEVPPAWHRTSPGELARFSTAGFPTGTHEDAVTATPVYLEGRVGGVGIRAAILAVADRALGTRSEAEIVDALQAVPAPRVVCHIDLPIGPAVRLRTRIRLPGAADEQAFVQFIGPILGDCRVVVTLVTGDLAWERELVTTFTEIAASMAVA